jgi:hypothetical protein
MTRVARTAELVRLAKARGLTVEAARTNTWYVSGPDGHLGLVSYNQRSGVWDAIDSAHGGRRIIDTADGLLAKLAAPVAPAQA